MTSASTTSPLFNLTPSSTISTAGSSVKTTFSRCSASKYPVSNTLLLHPNSNSGINIPQYFSGAVAFMYASDVFWLNLRIHRFRTGNDKYAISATQNTIHLCSANIPGVHCNTSRAHLGTVSSTGGMIQCLALTICVTLSTPILTSAGTICVAVHPFPKTTTLFPSNPTSSFHLAECIAPP